MIDFGLLVSMILAIGVPSVVARWWPLRSFPEPVGVFDVALGPGFLGLAVGRLTAVALDDPQSLGRVGDLLIIRSGVEFWAGAAAGTALMVWGAVRHGVSPWRRLADLAPLALIGHAAYEAACPFRDGCFGPGSAVGLRPPGLTTTMLPIGLVMAATVALGAVVLHTRARPMETVIGATWLVATVRAIGSVWLPHVGEGLTRQHQTSIVVAVVSSLVLVGLVVAGRNRDPIVPESVAAGGQEP